MCRKIYRNLIVTPCGNQPRKGQEPLKEAPRWLLQAASPGPRPSLATPRTRSSSPMWRGLFLVLWFRLFEARSYSFRCGFGGPSLGFRVSCLRSGLGLTVCSLGFRVSGLRLNLQFRASPWLFYVMQLGALRLSDTATGRSDLLAGTYCEPHLVAELRCTKKVRGLCCACIRAFLVILVLG